jgi:hypothetical protein
MMEDGYPASFADHPESVTEIRSNKLQAAAGRLPRDALLSVLKDIDRGEINPDHLVICYRSPLRKNDAGQTVTDTWYSIAGPDPHVVLGLLTRTIIEITGR